MDHLISRFQNSSAQLERLAAQRQLYREAKKLAGWQFILSVPTAVVWAFVILFHPALKVWAALWGLAISLFDLFVLDVQQKRKTKLAAATQELFDCDTLRLDWNDAKGKRPDYEDIAGPAKEYRKSDAHFRQLKDWYPTVVDALPLEISRLICQRSNLRWDTTLRKRYRVLVVTATVLTFSVLLVVGLIQRVTLEGFFVSVLAPALPALIWGLREVKKHTTSIETLATIKGRVEAAWGEALRRSADSEELTRHARSIQDGLFEQRSGNPLIPEFLYELLKDASEEEMQRGAEVLVREAQHKLGN